MSITHDRVKTATPDVDKDPDRISEGNVIVAPVPPLMGGEVSLTDHVGASPQLSPTPILITEPGAVFSTSAAVPLQRTMTTHWLADATRVVATSMRRIFLTATRGAGPARKHYPPHYSYLEHSRTAREIDRL